MTPDADENPGLVFVVRAHNRRQARNAVADWMTDRITTQPMTADDLIDAGRMGLRIVEAADLSGAKPVAAASLPINGGEPSAVDRGSTFASAAEFRAAVDVLTDETLNGPVRMNGDTPEPAYVRSIPVGVLVHEHWPERPYADALAPERY